MIKMIICDMDGTLLNKQKKMPVHMPALLEELRHEGVIFVAGSGRQYASLSKLFSFHKEHMYFISDNGCMVVRGKDDKILDYHTIAWSDVKEMVSICRSIPNTHIILSGKKKAYYETKADFLEEHVFPYYPNSEYVEDVTKVDDEIIKIAMLHVDGAKEHVYSHFTSFQDTYMVCVSAFEWVDIMPMGVHKGKGVVALQEQLGISRLETMVFGDFMNDYEMMQEAAFSFAMKNALDEIKRVSRYVTAYTNDEEGVYREIMEWKKDGWDKIKEEQREMK